MRKRILIPALFFIGFTACEKQEMPVKFKEIDEAGLARFTIDNHTGKDVATFTTELTWLSKDEKTLRVDTVNYGMKDKSKAFLKTGDGIFIVQKAPEGTTSATAQILEYKVLE